MVTFKDGLDAYQICARAEAKSPKTIRWILCSVKYFTNFLGSTNIDMSTVTADDYRRFVIYLQGATKFPNHPFTPPQSGQLSPDSINNYARGVHAFYGFLAGQGMIDTNPLEKVKIPKAPERVVPTFSVRQSETLLAQPNKQTDTGYRDYALILTFLDTTARLSEIANLDIEDVDLENGYLKVMGKGGKERYIPFGNKVAKALLKYKLKHRPQPVGTNRFWLTSKGHPLSAGRISKMISNFGKKAGFKRCYPHKLRHTSSVLFLRNGGDSFHLQKKLGHTSLQMTRHYSNLANEDVKAAQLKFGVADRLNG